jgi:peptidoglycan hydrolase CwlO-like protein
MTTKADLEKKIDELSIACGDYRRELNNYKERCAKAEEDLEDEKQKIDRAMNQIHFLA